MTTEITSHIYNTLKNNAVIRAALGKSAEPWGVYRQFPSEVPAFPIITINYDGDSDGGIESNMLPASSDYIITSWTDQYEALNGFIYLILNDNTINTYEAGIKLISLKWVLTGPALYDTDYKTYYQAVRYRAKWALK